MFINPSNNINILQFTKLNIYRKANCSTYSYILHTGKYHDNIYTVTNISSKVSDIKHTLSLQLPQFDAASIALDTKSR